MQIEKEDATERWICEEPFGEAEEKVLDHCHYIDKFLGSAHNRCSINCKTTHFKPVVAHNLSNYGLHCIVRSLSKSNPHNLSSVIPSTEEKILYLIISVLIKTYRDKDGKHCSVNSKLARLTWLKYQKPFLQAVVFVCKLNTALQAGHVKVLTISPSAIFFTKKRNFS